MGLTPGGSGLAPAHHAALVRVAPPGGTLAGVIKGAAELTDSGKTLRGAGEYP